MTESERIERSYAFVTDSMGTASSEFYGTLLLLREMGKRADAGDEDAKKLLEPVYQFERLLKTGARLLHEG